MNIYVLMLHRAGENIVEIATTQRSLLVNTRGSIPIGHWIFLKPKQFRFEKKYFQYNKSWNHVLEIIQPIEDVTFLVAKRN